MRFRALAPVLLVLALAACAPVSPGTPGGGTQGDGGSDSGFPAGSADGACGEINQFLGTAAVTEDNLNAALGFVVPQGEKCISSRENAGTVSTFVYYLEGDQAVFDALVEAAPAGGWLLKGAASTESAYFDFHTEGMPGPSDLPPDLVNDYLVVDYITEYGPSYLPAEYVQFEFVDAG